MDGLRPYNSALDLSSINIDNGNIGSTRNNPNILNQAKKSCGDLKKLSEYKITKIDFKSEIFNYLLSKGDTSGKAMKLFMEGARINANDPDLIFK